MSKDKEATTTSTVQKKDTYVPTRSASGAKSLSCGDDVAKCLEGMSMDDTYSVAEKLMKEDFSKKYSHLNVGMQRMNMGNRFRKFVGSNEDGLAKLQKATSPIQNRMAKETEKAAKAKAKEKTAKSKK